MVQTRQSEVWSSVSTAARRDTSRGSVRRSSSLRNRKTMTSPVGLFCCSFDCCAVCDCAFAKLPWSENYVMFVLTWNRSIRITVDSVESIHFVWRLFTVQFFLFSLNLLDRRCCNCFAVNQTKSPMTFRQRKLEIKMSPTDCFAVKRAVDIILFVL